MEDKNKPPTDVDRSLSETSSEGQLHAQSSEEARDTPKTNQAEEATSEKQFASKEADVNRGGVSDQQAKGVNDEAEFKRPLAKDQFQEELVIKPLPSGDIYSSFQFRTRWDIDFFQPGKKGKNVPKI